LLAVLRAYWNPKRVVTGKTPEQLQPAFESWVKTL
jgi:hypothetical protein